MRFGFSFINFLIALFANVRSHKICTILVINIFTEKIFIVLWLWYTMLGFLTVASFLYWMYVSIVASTRIAFVVRHMALSELQRDRMEAMHSISRFTSNFIKIDGIFVLRMVAAHASALFCAELVQALWNRYLRPEQESHIQKLTACLKQVGQQNSIGAIDEVDEGNFMDASDESHKNITLQSPLLNDV